MEKWKDIEGYEKIYAMSSYGRIKSFHRDKLGRLLKPTPNGRGQYPAISLCREGDIAVRFIHVLVAEAFLGPKEPDAQVKHIDENRFNNKIGNLEWTTHDEVMKIVQKSVRMRKFYLITLPEGGQIVANNLTDFCSKHKLRCKQILEINNGVEYLNQGYGVKRMEYGKTIPPCACS